MVVALPKAKERFATIIEGINPEPWTMLQFIIWLDLKLAEYKINGYMVLDQSIGSIPEWLANLNVDQHEDDFEDTHVQAPQFLEDESNSVEEILPVEMPSLTTAQYSDDDNHDYVDKDLPALQNKLHGAGNTFKRTASQISIDAKKRKFGARVQIASTVTESQTLKLTNNSPRLSMQNRTAESRLVAPTNRSLDSHKQLHVNANVNTRPSSTVTTANTVSATERGSININSNPPSFVHHRPVVHTSTVTQSSPTTDSKDEQSEPFPAQLFVNNVGLENRRAFPASPGIENSGYVDAEHPTDSSFGNVPQLNNSTFEESGDISTDSPNDFQIKTEPEDTRPNDTDDDDDTATVETPVSDLSMQAWQSINPKWRGSKTSVVMKSLLKKHNIRIASMANYQKKRCYQYTPEMRETIARYAIEYGTANASRWFSSELGHPIRGSTVHTMKLSFLKKYGSLSTESMDEQHS